MASTNLITKMKIFAEMIKFEHTIFALPFAYLGAFLAAGGVPSFSQFFWITLAMVGARTAAMSLNRIIDRHIDARNPRTASRAIPRGLLSVSEVWVYAMLSFLLLWYAAAQLNTLCVKLMPIAVFFLVIYSYTKRFTWLCHIVLGIAIGLAPLGAWVAIKGAIDIPGVLLGLAVATWIAGFDIIYACQDYDFDRRHGIYSIPSRFGLNKALLFARGLHLLTVLFLIATGILVGSGWFYYTGITVTIGILIREHSLVSPQDLSKVDIAFFNMNGIIAVLMFVFTLLDLLFG